tara:strand:+ start:98563 stop:98706 length:144 start_codon:yes stop_codon:yes gene_type:complete
MKEADVFRSPQVECPDCGDIINIDESQIGEEIQCEELNCNCVFIPKE